MTQIIRNFDSTIPVCVLRVDFDSADDCARVLNDGDPRRKESPRLRGTDEVCCRIGASNIPQTEPFLMETCGVRVLEP